MKINTDLLLTIIVALLIWEVANRLFIGKTLDNFMPSHFEDFEE